MSIRTRPKVSTPPKMIWMGAAMLAFVGAACAGVQDARKALFPPSFQYVEHARLHDAMWRMADDVAQIDALLRDRDASEVPQQEIVRLLDDMKEASSRVTAPGQTTNHLVLDRNMTQFQMGLALARDAAARTPPNYYLAGTVSGSCMSCHAGRSSTYR